MLEDPKCDESRTTEAEKMQRTAEVVKRMLAMPPKPKKACEKERRGTDS